MTGSHNFPSPKERGIPSTEVRLLGHLRGLSSFCSISQDTPLRVPPILPRGTAQGSLQFGGVECWPMADGLPEKSEKNLGVDATVTASQIPYVPLADKTAHEPALSYTPSHLYLYCAAMPSGN